MYFTSNHDENSWAGTEIERMGEGHKAFAALCCTIDGIPLIYSGQEEPLKKRLAFFEKDTIPFRKYEYEAFYSTLLDLKKKNKALWNGKDGGLSKRINVSDSVYAFSREKDNDHFIGVFNLSKKPQTTTLQIPVKEMHNVFTGKDTSIQKGEEITLGPWEYMIFSNR
jgi:glycosidase